MSLLRPSGFVPAHRIAVPPRGSDRPNAIDSGIPRDGCQHTLARAGVSKARAVRARPSIMRAGFRFVKSVNTRYCAFLLGQSQDVDGCGKPYVAGGRPSFGLPWCTGRGGGRLCAFPQVTGRTRLLPEEQVKCHASFCGFVGLLEKREGSIDSPPVVWVNRFSYSASATQRPPS